jgi:hypothetical protein
MAYNIYQSDGTPYSVAAGGIDNTFFNPSGGGGVGGPANGQGIQLIGQNTVGYGAAIAQTFLQLTENFCSGPSLTPPSDATSLQGQLWFNQLTSTTGNLYVRVTNSPTGGIVNWQKVATSDSSGNVTATTFTANNFVSTVTSGHGAPFTVFSTDIVPLLNATYAANLDNGTANQIPYQTGSGTTAFIAAPTPGTFLTWNGTSFAWSATPAATSANNVLGQFGLGGSTNQIVVQTAPSVTGFITAPSLANTFLEWNGSAFTWGTFGGVAVTSFNTRTGPVTLNSSDVTTALGFTPPSVSGTGAIGTWPISITGNAATAGSATTATSATSSTTAIYLSGGSAGQIPWQSAASTTSFTSTGTSGYYLQSNGTSSPTWVNPGSVQPSTQAQWGFYSTPLITSSGVVGYASAQIGATGGSFNNSTGQFTVTNSGAYFVTGNVVVQNTSSNTGNVTLYMRINGVDTGYRSYWAVGTGFQTGNITVSGIVDLSAGQNVGMYVVLASGAEVLAGYGYFSGYRIS